MHLEVEKLDHVADVTLIVPRYGGGPVIACFTEGEHGTDFFAKAKEYAREASIARGGLEVRVLDE